MKQKVMLYYIKKVQLIMIYEEVSDLLSRKCFYKLYLGHLKDIKLRLITHYRYWFYDILILKIYFLDT